MTQDSNPEAAPDNHGDEGEISLLDLALVFAENLRLLILIPLAAGFVALGIGYLITPTFTATTRILPPVQQQSAAAALAAQFGALAGLAGGAAGIKSPVDQYVAFVKSGPVLDAMIERFKLKELWKVEYQVDVRRTLDGITKVSAGLKDGIISIDVDDKDPKRAADMANAYVEELRNLMKTLAVTEPAQRRLFFDAQLKQAKENLTKSEIALRGSGISEATLKTVPQSALEALARIRAQITAHEVKLASMRTSMTDSNPDFRVVLQELGALRTELSKAEQSNTTKASGEGAEYIAKFRDFKYHETLFELMAKQFEIARLDEAREGAVIQVLEVAYPPERKSRPRKAVNAVFTTLAMFFAIIIFVLTRNAFRNLAKEGESAEKLSRLRQLLRLRRT
jgi:uncharacterized protein involved in exopolysaccharide biosynthesis